MAGFAQGLLFGFGEPRNHAGRTAWYWRRVRKQPIGHAKGGEGALTCRDGQRRIQFQLRKRSTSVMRSSETQQGNALRRTVPFEMCATAGSLAALRAGFRNLDI